MDLAGIRWQCAWSFFCSAMIMLSFAVAVILTVMITGCASLQSQYQAARSENTVESYEKFLAKHPRGRYSTAIEKALDSARFKRAVKSEDAAALESLLKKPKYPKSDYVTEARETLARLKADNLRANESLNGYQVYYAEFGDTAAARDLKPAFDEFYGRHALSSNKLDVFTNYLEQFPQGRHAEDVRKIAERMWWSQRSASADLDDLRQYMDLFPKGNHVSAVGRSLENKLWAEAEDQATDVDLYLEYIQRFPDGPRNVQARDSVDWSVAEQHGIKGVRNYMDIHSRGRFASRGKGILHEAEGLDEAMQKKIWDEVWDRVKNSMSQGGRIGSGSMTVVGFMSSGKTNLSYHGVVKEGGQARVLLYNGSRIEMSDKVYELVDQSWSPVIDPFFESKNENKGK